ncbi:MAG: tRNA preQ1(34) S-adenosylmethionine ribosyltransferase-isomerase QueA [Thermoguttaceae bacterium]|jgi:S-adenosylmethionine:tRNA ribosyltransferase-isomerase
MEENEIPQPSELEQYDYHLPSDRIAQMPMRNRTDARMLVVNRAQETIEHRYIRDIPEYLRAGDTLVLNNTKVVPARLIGLRAETGGRWEGLFLRFGLRGVWEIMSKTRGKLRPGERISLESPEGNRTGELEVIAHTEDKTLIVKPITGDDAFTFLDRVGWVPIPPYIRAGRMLPEDRRNYQTVYASQPGAVAAPTAGLHFTTELLVELQKKGVAVCPLTLHVGAGTFKPITAERLGDHKMHSEYASISEATVNMINERRAAGGRTIAVGTTSVRTLESAANAEPNGHIDSAGRNDVRLHPFHGMTDLFIRPPYKFKAVDGMLTNFHLPKSTLLILVRTFGGDELIMEAYKQAIQKDYRFYSYGDAMLIL